MATKWLTSEQAAARLGIKTETLYAYVSRGLLDRRKAEDGRSSLFDRAEVERLATRSRRGRPAQGLEVVVDTEISLLDPAGRLHYRGKDACRIAGDRSYEWVAAWLWTGVEPTQVDPWTARTNTTELAAAVSAHLPDGTRPADRLRAMAAAISAANPGRADLRPDSTQANTRDLVAAMVDALPRRSSPVDGSIAARLWAGLSDTAPTEAQRRFLDAVLVLLADHELAVSTFATRIAASARADPYLVVLCGLSVLGGPMHGAAGRLVSQLLEQVESPDHVPSVIADLRAAGQRIPGFGHSVYEHNDPRADVLLELLADLGPGEADVVRVESAMVMADFVRSGDGPFPNVDFAFGAAAWAMGFDEGASEVVFAVSRIVGWIAHALEEYREPFRFRPRAVYTGPEPET